MTAIEHKKYRLLLHLGVWLFPSLNNKTPISSFAFHSLQQTNNNYSFLFSSAISTKLFHSNTPLNLSHSLSLTTSLGFLLSLFFWIFNFSLVIFLENFLLFLLPTGFYFPQFLELVKWFMSEWLWFLLIVGT